MRFILLLLSISLFASSCAQGCAVAEGLYSSLARSSGAPSRADIASLDARQAEFLRDLRQRRTVILPVAVLGQGTRSDTIAANAIAEGLRHNGIAGAVATTAEVRLPFEPQANESAIFWSRFQALAAYVSTHPRPEADYVLLVDVVGAPERGRIGAIHAMAVTGEGEMAYRGAWNSHQPLYKQVRPRSLDDAARMVVADLTRRAASSRTGTR